MPAFPPDFDGAELRHQLYTLALSHFASVQHNYRARPDLHTLHNRSGELWSPLVALAAFFEEQGGVGGLLQAIATAAATDEQLSEGKALSEGARGHDARRTRRDLDPGGGAARTGRPPAQPAR
jgi:hypothetical protein